MPGHSRRSRPRASARTNLTPIRQKAFLVKLAETCSVSRACVAARISRTTIYEWRDGNPEFAKSWDAALDVGVSGLEDEAIRRAYHGVVKPVYQKARRCGTIREYSDTLLIFLLKAHRPKRYRENVKITGSINTGGALLIPGMSFSGEDWEKEFTKGASTGGQ